MTCAEFQRILPDLLESERTAELQAHLSSCRQCAGLVSDLKAISEQARMLQASEEPHPRVWRSLEAALRREGLIREPVRDRPFLVPSLRRRWRPAAWLVPVAAVLSFGVAFWLTRPAPQVAHEPARFNPPGIANTMDPEDQQVLAEVAKSAPMMEATYTASLGEVNSYIRDARSSLEQDPNDEGAQQDLMKAYEQKAMVYDMALERSLP